MTRMFDGVPAAPSLELGFATPGVNRAAWHREDAGWQAAAMERPDARFVAICNDIPVLTWDGARLDPLFDRAALSGLGDATETLFLGLDGEAPRFGVGIAAGAFDTLKARDDLKLIDMRSIAMQALFAGGGENMIGTAKAMLLWHGRHRFCSACGQPSQSASAGWKRKCASCGAEHFPRTDPVVIMLAIRGDKCLMGRAPQFPEGRYSCLAGFMEPGETFEDAVRREIEEETSVRVGRVRYLQAQPWPFPSSLMIGCIAEALTDAITIDPNELADARWFTKDEVRQVLAGEHPQAISSPPRMAIANHIMRAFVDDEGS
ncbi:MAG: NAD(+) diphosphatase [Beijerinckiaceae bacterium]